MSLGYAKQLNRLEAEIKELKSHRDELLEALEQVIDDWQYGLSTEEASGTYASARQVIAKAKGEV